MAREPDLEPFWLPRLGERAIVIGGTGSGKTTLNLHLLRHLTNSPVVIYDTKEEPKFETLPHHRVVYDDTDAADAVDDETVDYVIMRPAVETLADWRGLDELLLRHYYDYRGVDAYIDELLSFHTASGHNGPGLTALYTRGRSRGITTLASTQRPAKVSQFSMSEAQHVFLFHLNKADDRKKVSMNTGMPELPNPPRHHFWHYRTDEPDGNPTLIAPVPLPAGVDPGYTDPLPGETDPNPTTEIGHVWLGPRNFFTFHRGRDTS